MASSLAAKIEAEFGISPELIEGHGGVYELIVDDSVVYSNQGLCGRFPTDEVIFKEIRKFRAPLPIEGRTGTVDDGGLVAPSCSVPTLSDGECLPVTNPPEIT